MVGMIVPEIALLLFLLLSVFGIEFEDWSTEAVPKKAKADFRMALELQQSMKELREIQAFGPRHVCPGK
jgi:hypothetical protein